MRSKNKCALSLKWAPCCSGPGGGHFTVPPMPRSNHTHKLHNIYTAYTHTHTNYITPLFDRYYLYYTSTRISCSFSLNNTRIIENIDFKVTQPTTRIRAFSETRVSYYFSSNNTKIIENIDFKVTQLAFKTIKSFF